MLMHPNKYDVDELRCMTSICVINNQLEEAVTLFTNLLEIMKVKYGELHKCVGAIYHSLGIVHLHQDKYGTFSPKHCSYIQ